MPDVRWRDNPSRYQKQYRHDILHGKPRMVDAEPVRLHIKELIAAGMTQCSIAASTNVAQKTLWSILNSGQFKVSADKAERILALPLHIASVTVRPTSQPRVPMLGTRRRLEALLALGWRYKDIEEHCGTDVRLRQLLGHSRERVFRSTHDAVAKAYRELSGSPGPSERTRSISRARGYLTPAYWDDIDFDPEPDMGAGEEVDFDDVVVLRILDGDRELARQANKAEKQEVARRWLAAGRSLSSLEWTGWRVDRYKPRATPDGEFVQVGNRKVWKASEQGDPSPECAIMVGTTENGPTSVDTTDRASQPLPAKDQ